MSTQHDDTTTQEPWTDNDPAEGLRPVLFLEGSWHSNGEGPYGSYALDANAEIRGRWMLLTYAISEPTTHDVFYVSTQVYGYDDDGLILDLFDTAGSFTFRGAVIGDELTNAKQSDIKQSDTEQSDTEHGVRFEWVNEDRKPGRDFWKRSEFQQREGILHFRYDSMEPTGTDGDDGDGTEELLTFEGTWTRGKRPASG